MPEDYQPAPYAITLPKQRLGPKYDVEVSQELCWATLHVGGVTYECLGSNTPFWLYTHDQYGMMASPLERVLQMIRTGRNPEGLKREEIAEHGAWLFGEGRPLVAAWRKAYALAKHFCEHPHELRGALADEVVRRWQGEKVEPRALQLRTFIPKATRKAMGLVDPPSVKFGAREVLEVPF